MNSSRSTQPALASPLRGCELPAVLQVEILAAAAEFDATPAEIIAGERGHAFALIPSRAARRIRDVEIVAGLPPGTILSNLVISLVSSWSEAAPGTLAKWLDRHFAFDGDAVEKSTLSAGLYRLRARWQTEDIADNEPEGSSR